LTQFVDHLMPKLKIAHRRNASGGTDEFLPVLLARLLEADQIRRGNPINDGQVAATFPSSPSSQVVAAGPVERFRRQFFDANQDAYSVFSLSAVVIST
jgi:hypothetical protein